MLIKNLFNYSLFLFVSFTLLTRLSPEIPQETSYETLRLAAIQNTITSFLGQTPTHIPRIGFCFSGGGERAMVPSLGFMLGAEKTGLLDTCLYITGLSGSTWMLGNYYARQKSLTEIKEILRANLQKDFFDDFFPTVSHIIKNVEAHYQETHEIQMAGLWGGLIAEQLFADMEEEAHNLTFTGLIPTPDESTSFARFAQKYPFPIFTTVHPVNDSWYSFLVKKNRYAWFELTPYQARRNFSNAYCPMEQLTITPPQTVDNKIPLSLAYIMGVCGSAYAVNAADITTFLKESIVGFFAEKLKKEQQHNREEKFTIMQEILTTITYGRLAPAHIYFNKKQLTLVDAGLSFNLPLPPLLERDMDIIFICDASSNAYDRTFPELEKAASYAKKQRHQLPSLKNSQEISPEILVFEDKNNPQRPTLVYFHNPIEFDTTKMSYTAAEFDILCSYMETAVIKNMKNIGAIIARKTAQLNLKH